MHVLLFYDGSPLLADVKIIAMRYTDNTHAPTYMYICKFK